MTMQPFNGSDIESLINELKDYQKNVLLQNAQRLVPQVTLDDLMQPNDFPELENNPLFRYEEGVLAGIQTVEMVLRSARNNLPQWQRDTEKDESKRDYASSNNL